MAAEHGVRVKCPGVLRACTRIDVWESFQSYFKGEKNGEEFEASLWDEECGFRGADGSCRRDHDELECCTSPE